MPRVRQCWSPFQPNLGRFGAGYDQVRLVTQIVLQARHDVWKLAVCPGLGEELQRVAGACRLCIDLGAPLVALEDPFDAVVAKKIEQLRQAQTDGVLDASWDPTDILVFVSQLATSAVDPGSSIDSKQRTAFLAARRDAIKRAIQRLFPASTT